MTKIKLCGCFREEDIQTANILHPDFIGFVFFKKSHRYVAQAQALKLKRLLSPTIRAYGVIVNEDIENVMHLYHKGRKKSCRPHPVGCGYGRRDDA